MDDSVSRTAFFFVDFMEIFEGIIPESFRDLDARQMHVNLAVKLRPAHAFLGAFPILIPGAVVIGVVKKQSALHVLNRGLASRTLIVVPIGEFEPAVATHDLMLFFRRHH
jgi:hypothetical protein